MTEQYDIVSIGMPVYNGEKYIRRALDSLLAQDYEHFELIISDNASTDGTGAICQEYATRDGRISYCRNDANMGAEWNFQRVLDLAQGEYFMWAAHDDVWERPFIGACVEELQKNPSVVLCATRAILLDDAGNRVGEHVDDVHTLGMSKIMRLKKVILGVSRNTAFYGVYIKDALVRIQMGKFYGADHVFMAEFSLLGEINIRPEKYFYSQVGGAGNSVQGVMQAANIQSWFMANFPNLSFFFNYLGAVWNFDGLTLSERLLSLLAVIHRFTSPPYPKRIQADITTFTRTQLYKFLSVARNIKRRLFS